MTDTINPKLKLFRVRVAKTIFVVSEDAGAMHTETALAMAETDEGGWETNTREIEDLALVTGSAKTIPHSDDREFAQSDLTIADFFEAKRLASTAEQDKLIRAMIGEGKLEITNEEHFEKVRAFADKTGQAPKLYAKIISLVGEGKSFGKPSVLRLHYDFAPASFAFDIVERESRRHVMNGGIIYHGDQSAWAGGPSPTFSVTLDNSGGWQVHT